MAATMVFKEARLVSINTTIRTAVFSECNISKHRDFHVWLRILLKTLQPFPTPKFLIAYRTRGRTHGVFYDVNDITLRGRNQGNVCILNNQQMIERLFVIISLTLSIIIGTGQPMLLPLVCIPWITFLNYIVCVQAFRLHSTLSSSLSCGSSLPAPGLWPCWCYW